LPSTTPQGLHTEQPGRARVEKDLFEKENGQQVKPSKRSQNHNKRKHIYYKPDTDEKDEAGRPEFPPVIFPCPGKESDRHQTQEKPQWIDVPHHNYHNGSHAQSTHQQRRAY
jgi:hypothetical protein